MKQKLKELFITLRIYFTRSDICHKHWVKKIKARVGKSDGWGNVETVTETYCTVCRDELEAAAEAAKNRIAKSEDEFLESLEVLRKVYGRDKVSLQN